jgi:hypothetical protein
MGKLAERYVDAARSGVYRVASAAIPVHAAAEANARLHRLGVDGASTLAHLRALAAQDDRRPLVVLIDPGMRGTVPVEALHDLANECSRNALPFFAVMVDPEGMLELPGLYKER